MSVYTVHEPPLRATEAIADPESFVFVRDGFSVCAFLFSTLWMLWHRLWLVLLVYVVVVAAVETALRYLGASEVFLVVVGLMIGLLVGLEAGALRRFQLARLGWKNVGVVSGRNLEEAERRFFDAWLSADRRNGGLPAAASPTDRAFQPARGGPQPDGIVGLFPEPGAKR